MIFRNPEEYFYLYKLSEWERAAPPDKHTGELRNGRTQENTQTARMGLLLKLIDDTSDTAFRKLERRTQRRDGRSYVSQDASWMRQPCELSRGWYFEGNMSLEEKKTILRDLPMLGLSSSAFAQCAQDFVAGTSVQKYWPVGDEAAQEIERLKKKFDSEQKQGGA